MVARIPLNAFKQWLADRVDTLSPAMTLIVFVVPIIPLFPLKLIGLWLLTHQYWISAVLTIIFAKLLGVGVAAFVFDVTRPKLLEMAWFEKTLWVRHRTKSQSPGAGRAITSQIKELSAAGRWLVIADVAADTTLPQARARSALTFSRSEDGDAIGSHSNRDAGCRL